MSRHTQGPWFKSGHLGAGILVAGPRTFICVVYGPNTTKDADANANLIASAPDLRASLDPRTLTNIAEELERGSYTDDAGGRARLAHAVECLKLQAREQHAAIAKAEGRS